MSTPAPTPRGKPRHRRRAYGKRERSGMAILAVVTAVTICAVIVNEFGTRTNIDELQARNNLDQMRAHYLARSSMNLTDLILRLQKRVDRLPEQMRSMVGDIQLNLYAPQLMDAFGGDRELVEGALGMPMEDLKGMGADIGTFTVEIKPVEGKINVNCAAGSVANKKLVKAALETRFYPKIYDPVFEEPDAEGWRRDRKTQVEAILDYIDTDLSRTETNGAPEDYGYEGLKDAYKAKNKPLDSISELKLVRGVDDRFWTLFGDSFRAGSTSECKINLRSLDDVDVIVSIIYLAGEKDPAIVASPEAAYPAVRRIAELAIQAQQFGPVFQAPADFANFVKDPNAFMAEQLGGSTQGGTGTGTPSPTTPTSGAPLVPGSTITGVALDTQLLGQMVENKAIRVYDVIATGELERGYPLRPLKRTIRGSYHMDVQLKNSRVLDKLPPNHRNGTWLYLREE